MKKLVAALTMATVGMTVFAAPNNLTFNGVDSNADFVVQNDNVYISVADLQEFLGLEISYTADGVDVALPVGDAQIPMMPLPDMYEMPVADGYDFETNFIHRATVLEIDDEFGMMTILPAGLEDEPQNYINLIVGEDTILSLGTATLDQFEAGDLVEVIHSELMTRSMVPQAQAIAIARIMDGDIMLLPSFGEIPSPTIYEYDENGNLIGEQGAVLEGFDNMQVDAEFENGFITEEVQIVEIRKALNGDGSETLSIVVGDADDYMSQTIFIVGEPTVMIGGGVEDLVLGATVTVSYGPMMTMSLPPQTGALEITIIK